MDSLNQTVEDMLRACALDFAKSWNNQLHLVEFTDNNHYQMTISTEEGVGYLMY